MIGVSGYCLPLLVTGSRFGVWGQTSQLCPPCSDVNQIPPGPLAGHLSL